MHLRVYTFYALRTNFSKITNANARSRTKFNKFSNKYRSNLLLLYSLYIATHICFCCAKLRCIYLLYCIAISSIIGGKEVAKQVFLLLLLLLLVRSFGMMCIWWWWCGDNNQPK